MSFGENLQFYRTREGLTQEELAERLEVSRQSVSKWESNTSFPEMEKLMTCAAYSRPTWTPGAGRRSGGMPGGRRRLRPTHECLFQCSGRRSRLILLGVAAALSLYGLAGIPDTWCGAVILSAIAVSVAILVVAL